MSRVSFLYTVEAKWLRLSNFKLFLWIFYNVVVSIHLLSFCHDENTKVIILINYKTNLELCAPYRTFRHKDILVRRWSRRSWTNLGEQNCLGENTGNRHFCFTNTDHLTVPRRFEPLSCSFKRLCASIKMSNFERKYSPGSRHMICIGKTKRSIAFLSFCFWFYFVPIEGE